MAKSDRTTPVAPYITVLEELQEFPSRPAFEQMLVQDRHDWPDYYDEPWHIDACKLDRCDVSGRNLSHMRLWDSILVRTDLSGCRLFEAGMLRSEFVGCRLSGMQCGESTLKDVQFQQSKLDMANFRACTLERVTFVGCQLAEADFSGATLRDVAFINCEMPQVTFDKARCIRLDLTRSDISMLKGVMSLKGARITHEQMISLAPLLCAEVGFVIAE